ncbi:MAG: YjbH domain-containing protein [Pseudomonadota bacterium]
MARTCRTMIAGLALALAPGLAVAESGGSFGLGAGGFLGALLDDGPPERAFVLPGSDPSVASQAPAVRRAALNFYGMPGLVDMPTAAVLPDGELGFSFATFAGISRTTLTFQIAPGLTGAFRYNRTDDLNLGGREDYFDRAFDIQYQLFGEGRVRPALAVGLRDFAGTGIQAAEYVVATKTFALPGLGDASRAGSLRVTGGLGWGRLGSFGDIGAPFSVDRPNFDPETSGGEFSTDQWFRGPAAPFAGLEWQPGGTWDRLRVKLEYSSDAYDLEAESRGLFERRSPVNFGLEYQANDSLRVGLYSLYGSEVGAMVTLATNPRREVTPLRLPGPGPLTRRPDRTAAPDAWTEAWIANPAAPRRLVDSLAETLEGLGLTVTGLTLPDAQSAVLRVENDAFQSTSLAIGRTARAMAATLPPSVERFSIILEDGGVPSSTVRLDRGDLERFDGAATRAASLAAATGVAPPPAVGSSEITAPEGLYPRLSFALRPTLGTSLFDPAEPLRADLNLTLRGRYEPVRGLVFDGVIAQKLGGNIDESPLSPSELEPVRTRAPLYAAEDDPTIRSLTASYAASLGRDLYGRATLGYLERMFGGVSTELLWKPAASRLALGAEVNYVGQRDFDQRLGFQDYRVLTGHLSVYYEFAGGYRGQLDMGRYLAGDVGATMRLTRAFDNGWELGAFATLTDVSAEEFGEGSFDKGVTIRIPLEAVTGRPTPDSFERTIRPILRDGGARLSVSGRLYDRVRQGHAEAVFADWSRVWR